MAAAAGSPVAMSLAFNDSRSGTMAPSISSEEAAILAAHAQTQSHAVIYIVVVLSVYAIALALLVIKYVRRERDEARLSYLYDEFIRRDRSARSKSPERSPKPIPDRILLHQNISPV